MTSIFEIVTAQTVASYWDTVPNSLPPYVGEALFPNKRQLGIKIEFIKGANGVPVELKASNFDSKVMIRDRRAANKISTMLPYFKEAMEIDEEQRQELLIVLQTGNQAMIDMISEKIFNDQVELINGAAVVRERMRMQLLSTGRIFISNNGANYEYDYNLGGYQKETLEDTAKWSDLENSNPVADMNRWKKAIKSKTGATVTRAIMTSDTFEYVLNNKTLAKSIYITNNGVGIVTEDSIKAAVKLLTGITIYLNDEVYAQAGTDGTNAVKFFPDDVVTLLPDGDLGNTVFGTAPEIADLMSQPNVASVSVVDTGVAVTVTKETDPVNVRTKVSQVVMPTFEQANKIFIATVAGE